MKYQRGNFKNQNRQGKRNRPYGESLREAYSAVTFTATESSNHPRSPSRFFQESYGVDIKQDNEDLASKAAVQQVVHRHVNGLCIVTAGSTLPDKSTIEAVEIKTKAAPTSSAAEKRKRQAKMLKGGKVEDFVTPTCILAYLKLSTGGSIPLYSCVWGTILEVNESLTVDTLVDDPLLNGFLAVILPSGEFPPPKNLESKQVVMESDSPSRKKAKTDAIEGH